MVLKYGTQILSPGQSGADLNARAAVRDLMAVGDQNMPQAVVDEFLGTGDLDVREELLLELESNRSGYPQVLETPFFVDPGAPLIPYAGSEVDDSSYVLDSRTNSNVALAVADVSRADESYAAGPPTAGESVPLGLSAGGVQTVRGGFLGADGVVLWDRSPSGTTTYVTGLETGPYAYATSSVVAAGGEVLSAQWSPCSYYFHGTAGQRAGLPPRQFTLRAELSLDATTAATVTCRLRMVVRPSSAGGAVRVVGVGQWVTLTAAAAGKTPFQRISSVITETGVAPDSASREMRLEIEIQSATGSTRLWWKNTEMYAGQPRAWGAGRRAYSLPYGGVFLRVRTNFSDADGFGPPRLVNRVDVHGDARLGQVTSARVRSEMLVAGPSWGEVRDWGVASGAGRLSVADYAAEDLVDSVTVHVEELSSSTLWLSSIDAQLIVDVSDRLVSSRRERQREADAGQATLPLGNFEAATLSLDLDNSDRQLSPTANDAIDVGHRIESAWHITYDDPDLGPDAVFAIPAGVYYTTTWNAASSGDTVSIEAVDRLGRDNAQALTEPVYQNVLPGDRVRAVALGYLDLDVDETLVSISSGYLLPYDYPTGDVGTYLADIAKATFCVAYIDPLDRMQFVDRQSIPAASSAVLTGDNAVIATSTPSNASPITQVTGTASPLRAGTPGVLYELGDTEQITVPAGGTVEVLAPYSSTPATGVTLSALIPGTLTASVSPYAESAKIRITNPTGAALAVLDLALSGTPLVETALQVRQVHEPSRRRYGLRDQPIDARLIQTEPQLRSMVEGAIDAFAPLDAKGQRRFTDLLVDSVAILFLEIGDRVTIVDVDQGVGGDYQPIRQTIDNDGIQVLASSFMRAVDTAGTFARADADKADDGRLASY